MELIRKSIAQMIQASETELDYFLREAVVKTFKRHEILNRLDQVPNEVYFVNQGVIRVIAYDFEGTEHSIHFAFEQQFVTDYSSFLQKKPASYSLQAIEKTEVVVIPRSAIDWGYENMQEGQKMGRLVAEHYFIYQDQRIKNLFAWTPQERYLHLEENFPNIHNRIPQHMIASYLGITAVHLSRLKKQLYRKT